MGNEIFIVQGDLEIHPIALILPEMEPEEYDKFKEDILGNGVLDPIILFQGKVLDGRHRYKASRELEIDVEARIWEGGMDPVEYVVSRNIHRRHLTQSQKAMAAAECMSWHVEEAKRRQREAGGDRKSEEYRESLPESFPEPILEPKQDAHDKEAREQAGKLFGVSGRSVSGAKVIHEHGTDEEIQAVKSGKVGISKIEKIARERKRDKEQVNHGIQKPERKKPEYDITDIGNGIFIQKLNSNTKPTFNETNDNIEWAKWSWNPVTGCKFGCEYCYARKIAENSRYEQVRPTGFEPTFHPDRLKCPDNHSIPERRKNEPGINNIFLCSMADLWGDWIPSDWITQILDVVSNHPEYNFISLTKNPKRYLEFMDTMPPNVWIGATTDTQARFDIAVSVFRDMNDMGSENIRFLSCEPLLEEILFETDTNTYFGHGWADQGEFEKLHGYVNWVIIGALKGSENSDRQPKWSWVENLIDFARKSDASVYFKTNLTVTPKEIPTWVSTEIITTEKQIPF